MVKNFGIFFNDFWRLLTGFVKDSRSETPFRFIKFTCFGIFKLSFLSIFSFTCSIFIISTGILAFSTNEYIEYDLPFSFFVFIFSISYFFSKFIWIQVSKLGRRNILFHIFYVLFVLNVVNLIMYYNLFHISASTYFSVSFAYL